MQNYPVDKEVIVCMLDDNFECALSSVFFLEFFFSQKNSFSNSIRVSNSLDPDQAWQNVSPDSNCLQRLSATVNLEIFVRVLFSRNFAFHENDILVKWRNHSVVY